MRAGREGLPRPRLHLRLHLPLHLRLRRRLHLPLRRLHLRLRRRLAKRGLARHRGEPVHVRRRVRLLRLRRPRLQLQLPELLVRRRRWRLARREARLRRRRSSSGLRRGGRVRPAAQGAGGRSGAFSGCAAAMHTPERVCSGTALRLALHLFLEPARLVGAVSERAWVARRHGKLSRRRTLIGLAHLDAHELGRRLNKEFH